MGRGRGLCTCNHRGPCNRSRARFDYRIRKRDDGTKRLQWLREGVMSPGVQAASINWKRQGN